MAQDVVIKVTMVDQASAGITNLLNKLIQLDAQTKKISASTAPASSSIKNVGGVSATTASQIAQVVGGMGKLAAAGSLVAGPLGAIAGAMASAFGGAAISGFQSVVSAAGDFEAGMLRISKVMGGLSDVEMGKMKTDLLDISRGSLSTAQDLLKVAASAGQLGFSTGEIAPFVKLVDKMSVATNDTAESVALNFAKIRSAFNLMGADSILQLERLGSALNELENNTPVLAKNIVESLSRISAARTLDLAVTDVAAMTTTLQSTGLAASRSGTLLNRFFLELQVKTEKIDKTFNLLPGTFKKVLQEDASNAILFLIQKLKGMQDETQRTAVINELFGKQVIKVLDPMINNYDQLLRNMALARVASEENTSLTNAYAIASQGLNAALMRLNNVVEANKILIGDEFLGVLTSLVNLMPGLVDRVGEFIRSIDFESVVNKAAATVLTLGDAITKLITPEGRKNFMDFLAGLRDSASKEIPDSIKGFISLGEVISGAISMISGWVSLLEKMGGAVVALYDSIGGSVGAFLGTLGGGGSVLDAFSAAGGHFVDTWKQWWGSDSTKVVNSMKDVNAAIDANALLLRTLAKEIKFTDAEWTALGNKLNVSADTLKNTATMIGENEKQWRIYINALNSGKTHTEAMTMVVKDMVKPINDAILATDKYINLLKDFEIPTKATIDNFEKLTGKIKDIGVAYRDSEGVLKGSGKLFNIAEDLQEAEAALEKYRKSVSGGGKANETFEKNLNNTILALKGQQTELLKQRDRLNDATSAYVKTNKQVEAYAYYMNKAEAEERKILPLKRQLDEIQGDIAKSGGIANDTQRRMISIIDKAIAGHEGEARSLREKARRYSDATKSAEQHSEGIIAARKATENYITSAYKANTAILTITAAEKEINQIRDTAHNRVTRLNDAQQRLNETGDKQLSVSSKILLAQKGLTQEDRQRIQFLERKIALQKVHRAYQNDLTELYRQEAEALKKAKKEQIPKIQADFRAKRMALLLKKERTLALKELELSHKKELKIIDERIAKWKAFADNTKAAFEFAGKAIENRTERIKAAFESLNNVTSRTTDFMIKSWDAFVDAVKHGGRGSKEIIDVFREQAKLQKASIVESIKLAREQRLALERQRRRQESGQAVKFKIQVDGTDNAIRELVEQVITRVNSRFIAEGGILCGIG